jgi:DNA polymerase/3'-5' exonuclease PolX
MDKTKIIDNFTQLTKQIMIDIDNSVGQKKLINQYRLKSIATAIKALTNYKLNKITLQDLPDLLKLPGVGKGTIRRIEELIKTGKLSEIKITKLEEAQLKLLDDLEEIYGIGRTTAYKLFKEYKIKNIEDLKKRIANKEIQVSENIIKGLKYIDNLDTNIPRQDIEAIHEFLLDVLLEIDPKLFGTICGSFRRLKATSGDVDFIFIHEDYEKRDSNFTSKLKINYIELFVNKLIEKKFIIDSLTKLDVETKYMGIFRWKNSRPRRIDIRFIPTQSYYSAILYFTGSKDFNRKMRLIAIAMDLTLNEYGLFDSNGKMLKVKSEKEIFDLLNMEYITPDKR